ncbi:MAG: hypothetical protein ACWGO1_11700 [Anaerolineales bacterium]
MKNVLIRTILALLAAFAILFFIGQITGISFREMAVELVVYVMYAVLMLVYLMRFALIFVGVFAVYKLLRDRHGRQMAF